MEPIKPEKDEVDRFHSQRTGRPEKSKPVKQAKAARTAESNTVSLGRSAQFALVFIFVLVVGLAGVGIWQVKSQQQTIQTLDQQLEQASQFISQSKLITARLEGQINQTDATMAQSGNEMARELKFLDSEMRKLWDVSNKRNKQWIQENQTAIESLRQDLQANVERTKGVAGELTGLSAMSASLEQRADKVEVELTSGLGKVTDRLAAQEEQVGKVSRRVQSLDETLDGKVSALEARLGEQVQEIGRLQRGVSALEKSDVSKRLAEIEETLGALDKTRNQLVQRFVDLDSRMNDLTLELQALKAQKSASAN